jgi:hypothetical protein
MLAVENENIVGLKVDLVSRNGIEDRYFQVIKSHLIYVLRGHSKTGISHLLNQGMQIICRIL